MANTPSSCISSGTNLLDVPGSIPCFVQNTGLGAGRDAGFAHGGAVLRPAAAPRIGANGISPINGCASGGGIRNVDLDLTFDISLAIETHGDAGGLAAIAT